MIFDGFFHGTFEGGSLPHLWDYPETKIGDGSIDAIRAHEIMSISVRQFFDKYLKDGSAPWLDESESTPKVLRVEKIN